MARAVGSGLGVPKANCFGCSKVHGSSSEAMRRVFLSGEYLLDFLSLKDMGGERPRCVFAREKQAPENIIFETPFSLFQTLVLMEEVIRRDNS